MNRLRALVLTLLAVLALATPVAALDRVQWWYAMQPPSSWTNQEERDFQHAFGQLIWDEVGRTNTGGFFTNLSIALAATPMYVQVQPANTNQLGSLYQIGVADANSVGGTGTGGPTAPGGVALAPDATQLFHQGLLGAATTFIGPLVAPLVSGNSVIDLIECQVQTVDMTSTTVNYVSTVNIATSGTATRDRADVVVCQKKLGTENVTPTTPSTDANWVAIGTVTIPYGTTTLTTGMLSNIAGWAGFLPASAAAGFVDLTTAAQVITATKTWNAAQTYAGGLLLTNATLTLGAAPAMAADGLTNPGIILNVKTGSLGVQFYTNGAANGGSVTAAGEFKNGNYTLGSTGLVNSAASNLLTGTSATYGITVNNTNAAGAISQYESNGVQESYIDNAGTYHVGTTLISGASATASDVIDLNLPVGVCITTDSSHKLISAGGACGLASGTITNVVGTSPIASSVSSGTATISLVSNPTFTGNSINTGTFTIGTANNTDEFYWDDPTCNASTHYARWGPKSTDTVSTISGTVMSLYCTASILTIDASGDLGIAGVFNGSGAGLTSIPNTALVNSTISGKALGTNLSTLTFGTHVTGTSYNGSAAVTIGLDATNANTVSTLVARDANGDFSARIITAALVGNADTATTATNATNITTTNDTATNATYYPTIQTATGGTNPLKTSSTKLTFNPSTGLLTATGFSGSGANLTSIPNSALNNSTISGVSLGSNLLALTIGAHLTGSSYNGGSAVTIATDAVSTNTVSTIVLRDGSGNFSAGTITASLSGNATSANSATNLTTTDDTTTNATYYPTIQTATAGTNPLKTSSSKFTFNPSSGLLTATGFSGSGANLTGIPNGALSNSTISGIALGGTLNTLTIGSHLSGGSYNGSGAVTIATDCTAAATASTLVCRDSNNSTAVTQIKFQDTVNTGTAPIKYIRANGLNGHLEVVNNAGSSVIANVDDSGNVTATNFFNGSRREWKQDIHSAELLDADALLARTRFVWYRYRPGYGDPRVVKLGFIANDTDAILAGAAHDHFDAAALSGVNSIAIQQHRTRIEVLENEVRNLSGRLARLEARRTTHEVHSAWWYWFHPGAKY